MFSERSRSKVEGQGQNQQNKVLCVSQIPRDQMGWYLVWWCKKVDTLRFQLNVYTKGQGHSQKSKYVYKNHDLPVPQGWLVILATFRKH